MQLRHTWLAFAASALMAALTVRAEVKITVDRNEGDKATAAFKFEHVPAHVAGNAAAKATFTIVDGTRDENGGDLDKLHDGKFPTEEDQPAENFFFNAGTAGGRLAVDLGGIISIKQINTYSWHPDTRGPQVYKLYASDGSAAGFNARPKTGTDPEKAGWKLVASVDTRPKNGGPGGQYGVSIADPAGAIGKYRHLLFDMSRTESDDDFGNTFYSEINVIDAAAPAAAGTDPAPAVGGILTSNIDGKYEIVTDYTETPELKEWIETKLQPAMMKWYPMIVEMLPSDGYSAPKRFTVVFKKNGRGVAATGGTRVTCDYPWFSKNLQGEAVGAVIHEQVHVVQQYRGRGNPGWLVEGIADYIRWFKYEPVPAGTRPRNPDRAKYTDSYRTTAGFLNYVVTTHDKEIVKKLNAAMRQGKYKPEVWKEYTGKTVDELWDLYVKTLKPQ
ncbi:MAG: basic secretory protein-like protein [Tepidisphaerales bacterium]